MAWVMAGTLLRESSESISLCAHRRSGRGASGSLASFDHSLSQARSSLAKPSRFALDIPFTPRNMASLCLLCHWHTMLTIKQKSLLVSGLGSAVYDR
jgi:hypothetical protein